MGDETNRPWRESVDANESRDRRYGDLLGWDLTLSCGHVVYRPARAKPTPPQKVRCHECSTTEQPAGDAP